MKRHMVMLVGAISMSAFALAGCGTQENVNVNATNKNVVNSTVGNGVSTNNTANRTANNATSNSVTSNVTNAANASSGGLHSTTYITHKGKLKGYGYSIRVPADYKNTLPNYWTNNKQTKIEVQAHTNTTDATVQSALKQLVAKKHPSYKQTGSNWLVFSGIKPSHQVYYTKMFIGPGKEYTLTLQYPASEKKQDDSMVKTVTQSFKPGPLTITSKENSIHYPKRFLQGISKLQKDIGLSSVYLPQRGFNSKCTYAQRIAGVGGPMLVPNYNNFEVQESKKSMVKNDVIVKTVKLRIPSANTSITGKWTKKGLFSFELGGNYYLVYGLPHSRIEKIVESFSKVK